ncbi:hypothetical protein BGX27_010644 [Mortierella sp. AM989]|nr:hypothetical protein BGX27_010644 [Mortierella sp. AM989]
MTAIVRDTKVEDTSTSADSSMSSPLSSDNPIHSNVNADSSTSINSLPTSIHPSSSDIIKLSSNGLSSANQGAISIIKSEDIPPADGASEMEECSASPHSSDTAVPMSKSCILASPRMIQEAPQLNAGESDPTLSSTIVIHSTDDSKNSNETADPNEAFKQPTLESMTDIDHPDEPEAMSDLEDIWDDNTGSSYPSAIFRPQLDDIVLDQDLLDFYEQLKFLISLSPLKTAQVLYAFSSATEHLSLELEVRRSALDMNKKAFSFYQDNTWFIVDLEPTSDFSDDEASESSDPRFKILPARHALFPAFQRHGQGHPTPFAHYPYPYYNGYPYAYPYESAFYMPPSNPSQTEDAGAVQDYRTHLNPDKSDLAANSARRHRSRDWDRHSRGYRHGMKSSKRRGSRDLDSPVQRSSKADEGRTIKRSRQDPDSPSLSSIDGGYSAGRNPDVAPRSSMEPPSPQHLSLGNKDIDRPKHRNREEDDDERELARLERRLARKRLKHANKHRSQRGEEQGSALGERVKENGSGAGDASPSSRGRPLKITLVQSGKSLSSSIGQSSLADSTGHDRPKPLHGWIPPSADQGENEGSSQTTNHRSIRPSSDGKSPGTELTSKNITQKPSALNTQLLGQQSGLKKKSIQATPIQSASSNGPTSPQGSVNGALYTDKSDDKLKKGTWTTAEEEILLEAVRDLSSENWHAVAMKVPGRNAKQCMQKWQTDLDPQINRLPWTPDEDEKLVEAYHTFGNSWQQIAKMVETRTWYQCYNRVRAKSVKTKIMMTAGTHPASIANGGGRGASSGATGGKDGEPKKIAKEPQQGIAPGASAMTTDQRTTAHLVQSSVPAQVNSDKSVKVDPEDSSRSGQYTQMEPNDEYQQEASFNSAPKQAPVVQQQQPLQQSQQQPQQSQQPPQQSLQHQPHQAQQQAVQQLQQQPQQQSQQKSQPQTYPPQQQQQQLQQPIQQQPSRSNEQQPLHHQIKCSNDAPGYWSKQIS